MENLSGKQHIAVYHIQKMCRSTEQLKKEP